MDHQYGNEYGRYGADSGGNDFHCHRRVCPGESDESSGEEAVRMDGKGKLAVKCSR